MGYLSVKYMPKPSKWAKLLYPKKHKPSPDGYDIVEARKARNEMYKKGGGCF